MEKFYLILKENTQKNCEIFFVDSEFLKTCREHVIYPVSLRRKTTIIKVDLQNTGIKKEVLP